MRERRGNSRSLGRGAHWSSILLGAIAVVLAVLLGLSLSFGWAFFPPPAGPAPPLLTVTGIDRQIIYQGSTAGAIGPEVNDSCAQCPLSFPAGAQVSITLFTFRVDATLSEVALHVFLNSTVPTWPFAGWSCPGSGPCPPPVVTSSSFILIYPNGYSITWGVTFDPPANSTPADNGGVTLTIYVAPCSSVNFDWNYCP